MHVDPGDEHRQQPPRRQPLAPHQDRHGEQHEPDDLRARVQIGIERKERECRRRDHRQERAVTIDGHVTCRTGGVGADAAGQPDQECPEHERQQPGEHTDARTAGDLVDQPEDARPPPARHRELGAGPQERVAPGELSVDQQPPRRQVREEAVVGERPGGHQRGRRADEDTQRGRAARTAPRTPRNRRVDRVGRSGRSRDGQNDSRICRTAGPSTTRNRAGKMQNTMGISIFTGAFWARSSAA